MPVILIVEKTGSIKELAVKVYAEEDLYKKAGFKSATDFRMHHAFDVGTNRRVHVYGKTSGKAGQENKYEFPPPLDHTLFFGSCVLVLHNMESGDEVTDLTKPAWKVMYETLLGGLEDLGSEDSSEEELTSEEERMLASQSLTSSGYVKDDFVVDDSTSEEEEEYVPSPKKRPVAAKKTKRATKAAVKEEPDTSSVMECQDELTEEEYFK